MTSKSEKERERRRAAEMAFDEALGARVKRHRIDAEMTQENLGNEIGKSFIQVSRMESGLVSVSTVDLVRMASVFRCKPSSLIDGLEVKL